MIDKQVVILFHFESLICGAPYIHIYTIYTTNRKSKGTMNDMEALQALETWATLPTPLKMVIHRYESTTLVDLHVLSLIQDALPKSHMLMVMP